MTSAARCRSSLDTTSTAITRSLPIRPSSRMGPQRPKAGITGNRAPETDRASDASAWPVETLLRPRLWLRHDVLRRRRTRLRRRLARRTQGAVSRRNQPRVRPRRMGAIGAWAWGLSRAMDYLQTDPGVAKSRVAVIGHSRLGKTALWAEPRTNDSRWSSPTIGVVPPRPGAGLVKRCGASIQVSPLVLRTVQGLQQHQRRRPCPWISMKSSPSARRVPCTSAAPSLGSVGGSRGISRTERRRTRVRPLRTSRDGRG